MLYKLTLKTDQYTFAFKFEYTFERLVIEMMYNNAEQYEQDEKNVK